MSSLYRIQLENYLRTLNIACDRVIDVGGAQLRVNNRVQSWNVKEYVIADLAKPHEGDAPDVVLDLNNAVNAKIEPADIVFCLEVMEYIYDPQMAIVNLSELTKRDGVLFITFPYFYPPHEPHEQDYMRYTLAGAEKLLKNAGFEIDEIHRRTCAGIGMKMVINDNALRPSKNVDYMDIYDTLGFIIQAHRL